MKRFLLPMLALSSFIPCFAVGGAVPVRIPLSDGSKPRCIDSSKDKIWFTLRRVVTTRSRHWFTQDNSVAAIVTATVKTDPQPAKPILFPLMTEATLRDFAMGQISVPIEYTIVDGLNLKQGNVTYTGIGIEVTLLNRRGKNAWGSALAALDEITKKLPIPASPFTQSATYLMDFANSAVTKDLDGQQSDDKVKSAALALNFDPTGSCAGPGQDGSDFETTGTIAVLQEGGLAGPGYVEISRTNEYCWSAELRPAFVLSAAPKVSGVACTDSRYKDRYKQVTNNYVGFFLNAIGSTRVLGAAPARDREDSLNRCIANGIDRAQCLN